MKVTVRPETSADIAAIHHVVEAAFANAAHADHTEQFIVDALRDAGALTASRVAEQAGTIVGHAAVSPVMISDGSASWYGLGPVAVRPDTQGQGVGSLLVRFALQALREREAAGCVVLGDPAYYARFGFRSESGLVLPGVPPEYFQVLSFGTTLPSGQVAYHPSFYAKS